MNTYKVPDRLANKYHGAGLALAATANGDLVSIVYIEDILPDFSGEVEDLEGVINDERIAPTIRELRALGNVHVGMLSGWEFVEL